VLQSLLSEGVQLLREETSLQKVSSFFRILEFGASPTSFHCPFSRCGNIYCAECTTFEMKLGPDAQFHPQGISCKVCNNCFLEHLENLKKTSTWATKNQISPPPPSLSLTFFSLPHETEEAEGVPQHGVARVRGHHKGSKQSLHVLLLDLTCLANGILFQAHSLRRI